MSQFQRAICRRSLVFGGPFLASFSPTLALSISSSLSFSRSSVSNIVFPGWKTTLLDRATVMCPEIHHVFLFLSTVCCYSTATLGRFASTRQLAVVPCLLVKCWLIDQFNWIGYIGHGMRSVQFVASKHLEYLEPLNILHSYERCVCACSFQSAFLASAKITAQTTVATTIRPKQTETLWLFRSHFHVP